MTFSTRRAARYYLGGRHSPLLALRSYLLIPADELGRQGRHTLIVRDSDSSGAPFGEYSFDVTY